MDMADKLRELGRNLYWTWHPEIIEIFRVIDPSLWREANHNPVEFLSLVPADLLREKAQDLDLALDARIAYAFHGLHDYLNAHDTWGARYAGRLRANPVAFFAAEFGLHESLPIYAGGLGVLAGDYLKDASDMGLPVVAVGLFYAKGYFHQALDSKGWQEETYSTTDVNLLPLEPAMTPQGQPLRVAVQTHSGEIAIGVWTARVGRNRLVLLDTHVEGNTEDDRDLTTQLYGGGTRVRIRQELVLGVGGMRALEALGIQPGVLHLNEGHSAFAPLELARQWMESEGRTFASVQERIAAKTVFTTHTPVEAGHDRFDPAILEETLGPLREQLGITEDQLLALGRKDPTTKKGELFCMTILGFKMSRLCNAVSAIHARVSRSLWRDLWPELEEHEVPIGYVTNGIHAPSWLASTMAQIYNRCLGEDWQQRIDDPQTWEGLDRLDEVEFWEQHQILKAHLIDYVRRCICHQAKGRGEPRAQHGGSRHCPDPSILTIGFARRFTGYKRADLLLQDLDRLDRLVNHPERPVQIIYAGKAHPADKAGKQALQKVFQITRDPRFAGRIILVEDHDINVSRHLVQGVDVWLNTPYRPLEACGTSGQKVVLNGGLNLSILDGWWAEAYDGTNGFAIGRGIEHVDPRYQTKVDMLALYETLENEVVPLFYDQDENGVPHAWIARQKNALRTLAWRFSARRMLKDYALWYYLPAAGGLTASVARNTAATPLNHALL